MLSSVTLFCYLQQRQEGHCKSHEKICQENLFKLRIEEQIDQVCTKSAEFLLSGKPFTDKDVHKEDYLTGLSFISIPLPKRNSITKNGAKYYIPKKVKDLILQLKAFHRHLIILFAKKPSKELKAGKQDKNSGICLLARDLLQQVLDSKSSISATFEKYTVANPQ